MVNAISFVSRARQGRLWLRSVESIPAATCNINIYVPGLYYCRLQIDVWRKYVSLIQEKKKKYRISIAIVIGKKNPLIINNTEIGCYGLNRVDKIQLFFWRETISSFDKKDPPHDQTAHADRYNKSPSVPYVSLYPAMIMSYV